LSKSSDSSDESPTKNLRKGLYIPKAHMIPSYIASFNKTAVQQTKQEKIPRIKIENMEERKSTQANSPLSGREKALNKDLSFVLTKRSEEKERLAREKKAMLDELHTLR